MTLYIIIQTLILTIAAGFGLYGDYQSNDCVVLRRRKLYNGISCWIIAIFVLDLFAILVWQSLILR